MANKGGVNDAQAVIVRKKFEGLKKAEQRKLFEYYEKNKLDCAMQYYGFSSNEYDLLKDFVSFEIDLKVPQIAQIPEIPDTPETSQTNDNNINIIASNISSSSANQNDTVTSQNSNKYVNKTQIDCYESKSCSPDTIDTRDIIDITDTTSNDENISNISNVNLNDTNNTDAIKKVKKPHKCPKNGCNKAYFARSSLTGHLQKHDKCDEIPFQCQFCQFITDNKRSLQYHIARCKNNSNNSNTANTDNQISINSQNNNNNNNNNGNSSDDDNSVVELIEEMKTSVTKDINDSQTSNSNKTTKNGIHKPPPKVVIVINAPHKNSKNLNNKNKLNNIATNKSNTINDTNCNKNSNDNSSDNGGTLTKDTKNTTKDRNKANSNQIFKCPKKGCNVIKNTRAPFLKHLQTHSRCDEIPFECEFCKWITDSKKSLQNHIGHCSLRQRLFVCQNCQKRFSNKKHFDNHLKYLKQYSKCKNEMVNDNIVKHDKKDKNLSNKNKKKEESITINGETNAGNKDNVKTTESVHVGFACEECGKTLTTAKRLQNHYKVVHNRC